MSLLQRVVFDTNLYIHWLNQGLCGEWMGKKPMVRYLSSIVHMELRLGAQTRSAHQAVDQLVRGYGSRLLVPTAPMYDQTARVLQRLRAKGLEIRKASLVNDVLIALSARSIGATLVTLDRDFETIQTLCDFRLERIKPV